jgi:hypothetical protein
MPVVKALMMNCWICGKKGRTGEHLVKASDLKSLFGRISQEDPVYYHTKGEKNIPVGSLKSTRLKSKALICNDCNSSLTQPYDKAWEKLSLYLRSNWTILERNGKLNLSKIFPGSTRKSFLDVHLYFVKLFGCKIIEDGVPIDISGFSHCLQQRVAHSDIYIAIGNRPGVVKHKYAAITPIESVDQGEKSVLAAWLYIVDNIAVNVIYSIIPGNEEVLRNTWHPSTANRILRFAHFET